MMNVLEKTYLLEPKRYNLYIREMYCLFCQRPLVFRLAIVVVAVERRVIEVVLRP